MGANEGSRFLHNADSGWNWFYNSGQIIGYRTLIGKQYSSSITVHVPLQTGHFYCTVAMREFYTCFLGRLELKILWTKSKMCFHSFWFRVNFRVLRLATNIICGVTSQTILMVNQAQQCSSQTDLSDLVQLSNLLIEGLWIFLIVSTDHLEKRKTELTSPGIIQKVVQCVVL